MNINDKELSFLDNEKLNIFIENQIGEDNYNNFNNAFKCDEFCDILKQMINSEDWTKDKKLTNYLGFLIIDNIVYKIRNFYNDLVNLVINMIYYKILYDNDEDFIDYVEYPQIYYKYKIKFYNDLYSNSPSIRGFFIDMHLYKIFKSIYTIEDIYNDALNHIFNSKDDLDKYNRKYSIPKEFNIEYINENQLDFMLKYDIERRYLNEN